jgi:hypothetical protein
MLEVQYEDLTADLEAEARRIVGHCGLEWEATCLSFHETERPVRTTVEVRQPIYRSSIGRWRAHAHLLRPLIEALGVDVAGSPGSAPSVRAADRSATSAAAHPPQIPDTEAAAGERADTRDAPILPHLRHEKHGRQKGVEAPTSQILIDGVKAVAIHNGLLRVDCVAAGPNNEERSSGTLLIPGNQAGPILRALTQAMQKLDKRSREQALRQPNAH